MYWVSSLSLWDLRRHIVKWSDRMMKHFKVNYSQMNGIRERVKVACEKLACPCQLFEERIKSPGQSLGVKLIIEALGKKSVRNFTRPNNINQNCVFLRNWSVGLLWGILATCKGATSRPPFKFCSGTRGLFEELDRHAKEYSKCGACKEPVDHVLFKCASCDSQDKLLLTISKKSLFKKDLKLSITVAFLIKLCFVKVKKKVCWLTMNVVHGIIEQEIFPCQFGKKGKKRCSVLWSLSMSDLFIYLFIFIKGRKLSNPGLNSCTVFPSRLIPFNL